MSVKVVGNCPKCGNPIYGNDELCNYANCMAYYEVRNPPKIVRTRECFVVLDRFNGDLEK